VDISFRDTPHLNIELYMLGKSIIRYRYLLRNLWGKQSVILAEYKVFIDDNCLEESLVV